MPSKNSVFQVAHYGDADNQVVVNVTDWIRQLTTDPDPSNAEMQGFADILTANWVANCLTSIHSKYTFRKTVVKEVVGWNPNPTTNKKRLTFAGGWESVVGTGTVGAVGGDPLPNTTAAVVRKITNLAGKRWRGKVKVSPLGEVQSDYNVLTPTAITLFNNKYALYFTTFTVPAVGSGAFSPAVFSPTTLYAGPQTGPARPCATPITTVVTTSVLGVQKSRKLRPPG